MKYFKKSEFNCPCCGENKMSLPILGMLDEAREIAGIPFVVNSGYRCKTHNSELQASSTSSHTKGLAVDIKADTSRKRMLILDSLIKVGFNRIGIGKNFIHCDIDSGKDENVIWLY